MMAKLAEYRGAVIPGPRVQPPEPGPQTLADDVILCRAGLAAPAVPARDVRPDLTLNRPAIATGRCLIHSATDPGLDAVICDLGSDRFLDQAEVAGECLAHCLVLGAAWGAEGVVVDAHAVSSFRGTSAGRAAGPI